MSSKWHEKKKRIEEYEFEKALQLSADDTTLAVADVAKAAAMGKGDDQIFEKKLSKEEKKARAKAAREAKKKKKKGKDGADEDEDDGQAAPKAAEVLTAAKEAITADPNNAVEDDGVDHEKADALAAAGTICTYSASRKGVDARARDINVTNFTLQHKVGVVSAMI
jgi:hypothetical protein